MNKKVAMGVVIVLLVLQCVFLAYLYIKYNLEHGDYLGTHLKYYFMTIIFYAVLNDALIFTIGILIYYKEMILKSKIVSVSAILLSLSIVLLVVSGTYYGLTIGVGLENTNFRENINNVMNIYYVIYTVCFTVFVLISFKVNLFSDKLPKILLLVVFFIMIFVYLRQATYYGFIAEWSDDYRVITSIRQGISILLLYPASIVAFIVSTLILVKNQDVKS